MLDLVHVATMEDPNPRRVRFLLPGIPLASLSGAKIAKSYPLVRNLSRKVPSFDVLQSAAQREENQGRKDHSRALALAPFTSDLLRIAHTGFPKLKVKCLTVFCVYARDLE